MNPWDDATPTLPSVKSNNAPYPDGLFEASDSNKLRERTLEMWSAIRTARRISLSTSASEPVSDAGTAKIRFNGSELQMSLDGEDWEAIGSGAANTDYLSVLPSNGIDDKAAIITRIADAQTLGYRRVHFGKGSWKIDTESIADATTLVALIEVPSNFAITGEGPWRSVLEVLNATETVAGYGVNVFGATSEENITIEGLHFLGENDPYTYIFNNQGSCIRTHLCSNVLIRNCRAEALFGFSYHDDGSERVHCYDSTFEDCANGLNLNGDHSGLDRLHFLRSEGPEVAGAYCLYSNIIIEDAQGVGLSLGGNQSEEKPGSEAVNITIDGSTGNGVVVTDGFTNGSLSNIVIRKCQLSGLNVFEDAGTVKNLTFNNVTVDSNCVHPNLGTIVGADISGTGGHSFFNCKFTDQDISGFRQIQAFSLNAPDCSVDSCTFQGHTATVTNKDASFGALCTNLKLGGSNRFVNATQEFLPGCTIAANELLGVATTDRVFEFRIWNDSPGSGRRRWAIQRDGKQTWGNGLDLEDTNFYRDSAGVLKTDGSLVVGGSLTVTTSRTINGVAFNGSANIQIGSGFDRKPTTPHADDEEFEGTLSAWTAGGSQQATALDPYASFTNSGHWRYNLNSKRPSWLLLQPASDAGNYITVLHKPITVPTNQFIWTRMSFNRRFSSSSADDCSIGFMLSASSGGVPDTNNRVAFYLNEMDAGELATQVTSTVAGVSTTPEYIYGAGNTAGQIIDVQYLGMQKLGTTYHFWIAGGSMNWMYWTSVTNAASMDRISIQTCNGATTTPGNMVMGVDFIRFINSADAMP